MSTSVCYFPPPLTSTWLELTISCILNEDFSWLNFSENMFHSIENRVVNVQSIQQVVIRVWLDINRLKSNARSLSDLKVNNAYYFRVILVVVCTVQNRLLLLPYLLKEQLDLTQWEQKPKQKDKGKIRKVRKNKKQRWLKTHWTDKHTE